MGSTYAIGAAACSNSEPPPQSQPTTAAASVDAQGSPILASPAEQVRMQQYIDALYDRRHVRASFSDGNSVFDCVDWDKQPACRTPGACTKIATPPPPPPPPPPIVAAPRAAAPNTTAPSDPPPSATTPGSTTPNGTTPSTTTPNGTKPNATQPRPTPAASPNARTCPKGTVPIQRPTIDVLRRFRTLEDYFRK
ncbi:hypothetical protein [Pendulispora albinea]|uniref:Uncharacterized protein n=1 Tax=Pendulispora albinea TaxID=2741071 RepID=A0ABZ2LTZ4_9BACT